MKRSSRSLVTALVLFSSCWACMEISPIAAPTNLAVQETSCQASPIEKNIIGTWHFESNRRTTNIGVSGTVVFDTGGNISDPDSLFQNTLDGYRVTSKMYNAKVDRKYPDYSGYIFEVYQTNKLGKYSTYFTVVSNECRRVQLKVLFSSNNDDSFVLTR